VGDPAAAVFRIGRVEHATVKALRTLALLALFAACAIGGLVLSTVATYAAWNIAIEPAAFRCVDDLGFLDSYWCNMDEHRAAGDTVSPGWTWEKLKVVRIVFIAAFYAIWAASALIPFGIILRRMELSRKVLRATNV
jgi:hypothetical protein